MKKLVTLLLLLSLTLTWGTSAYAAAPEDDLQVLHDVLSLIEERFLQDADKDSLISGALAGMLQALGDPYSEYFTPDEYTDFISQVTSREAGIGIVPEQDAAGRWLIQSVVPGTPAESAGLQPGDVLRQANGVNLTGASEQELRLALGGEVGSQVALTLERDGMTLAATLTRAWLDQPTVSAELLSGGIGYVYLASFGENTAHELSLALADLQGQGMRALLLDLRDNPGGMMQSVIDVAELLLPAGPMMRLVDRSGQEEVIRVSGPGLRLPMAALVNQMSASAAEVLAGAVHDRGGALLVGERTYGKGVMQDIYELGENGEYGAMKITTAEFYTPRGTKIQETGLAPDLEIEPVAGDLPFLDGAQTLYPGLQGEAVRTLQQALQAIDVYEGQVTGTYDEATRLAVRSVQLDQGDPVGDGVSDGWTQMLINDQLAMQAIALANQQMIDAARAWLMGQVMVSRWGINRWGWLQPVAG